MGGGFAPTAAFVHHLVARVPLRVDRLIVATGVSPPNTGWWGAIGDD